MNYAGYSAASGGIPAQSWWPQQQQHQRAHTYDQPTGPHLQHYGSPSPWVSAGGNQPQGTAACAAPMGPYPVLSPPSAIPAGSQRPATWSASMAGQAAQHRAINSPAQPVFGAPQAPWPHRHPTVPTGHSPAHGLPGLGTHARQPADPVQASTLVPGPGSIALGVPVRQRSGAESVTNHSQAALGLQHTGFDPGLQHIAPAGPAPRVPQPSRQQSARQPSSLPAAAVPPAQPAVPQPQPHTEHPAPAVEPTAQPPDNAGCGDVASGEPHQDGDSRAARLRRLADADAGTRQTRMAIAANCMRLWIMSLAPCSMTLTLHLPIKFIESLSACAACWCSWSLCRCLGRNEHISLLRSGAGVALVLSCGMTSEAPCAAHGVLLYGGPTPPIVSDLSEADISERTSCSDKHFANGTRMCTLKPWCYFAFMWRSDTSLTLVLSRLLTRTACCCCAPCVT